MAPPLVGAQSMWDDPQRRLADWTGDDPCAGPWSGVGCRHALPCSSTHDQRVTRLVLTGFNLSGPLDRALGDLTELGILNLAQNRFHGAIPRQIGQLVYLSRINFAFNELNGTIPADELGKIIDLVSLNLNHNNFTGEVPDKLRQIQFLNLTNNGLTGTVSAEHCQRINLVYLNLDYNELEGELPGCLSAKEDRPLQQLTVSHNRLSGPLPAGKCSADREFSNFDHISILDVSHNRLNGTISPNLQYIKSVVKLRLNDNQFSGTIPGELSQCVNLASLELQDNNLTGAIPPEFNTFMELKFLNVSNNDLEGTIPTGFLTTLPASSFEGNAGLCGPPLPDSCIKPASPAPEVPVIRANITSNVTSAGPPSLGGDATPDNAAATTCAISSVLPLLLSIVTCLGTLL
eukprot:SM000151S01481  [mRNA]  locus=s151:44575:47036:- [translate_table: standard]